MQQDGEITEKLKSLIPMREVVAAYHGGELKRSGSNWQACCPFHDDSKPSLTVYSDHYHCFSCEAHGDIFDFLQRLQGVDFPAAQQELAKRFGYSYLLERPAKMPAAKTASPAAAVKRTTYIYSDKDGTTLYRKTVLRSADSKSAYYERKLDNGKFAKGMQGLEKTLYRLPEVLAAATAGKTIWLVEGEKDADTLAALKLVATTAGGSGDWNSGFAQLCAGAEQVVILPDNDAPGLKYAELAARDLVLAQVPVKIVNLPGSGDIVTAKGTGKANGADISDWLAAGHTLGELQELVTKAAGYAVTYKPLTLAEEFADMVAEMRLPYHINDRGITCESGCDKKGEPTDSAVANFIILPREELRYFDGENTRLRLKIEGLLNGNEPLPADVIEVGEANDVLDAALTLWGMRPAVCAGRNCRDKLRYLTQRLSHYATRRKIYTSTGWYSEDGERFYLHAGGVVGTVDTATDLTEGGSTAELAKFRLPTDDAECDYQLALQFLEIADPDIVYPLAAVAALAPALELLREAGLHINFLPFLVGRTGSGKSTLALIVQSFFGDFRTTEDFPANFKMTANSVEKIAFLLKDTLMVVDDYYPGDSQAEQKRLADFANRLARGYGDGAARKRMRSDGKTLHAGYRPRGLALMTGEMKPEISEGGQARYFFIDVTRDKVDFYGKMATLDKQRQKLPAIMRKYLVWLRANWQRLQVEAGQINAFYIEALDKENSGRQCNAARFLMLGLYLWFEFLKEAGALSMQEVNKHIAAAESVLKILLDQNLNDLAEEKPAQKFIGTLKELLAGADAELLSLSVFEQGKNERFIGWQDDEAVYLIPTKAFAAVQRRLRDAGCEIRMKPATVWRELLEMGLLVQGSDSRKRYTRPVRIEGGVKEVLKLKRSALFFDVA